MIECILTIDYEIYGNGDGSLRELVYEPAEKLHAVFHRWNARCVVFVEAAELEIIGLKRADPAIYIVERQIRELHREGFEIGLHLHPQWYNARYEGQQWKLDYGEYNLCRLSPDRINQIVGRSIQYLRRVLEDPVYTPISFRAGNWLLQPTSTVARLLADHGIKIDSSVFKGGLQYQNDLDYRSSRKNGYYWTFTEDVNIPDPQGSLLELPTYTMMLPLWKMLTSKRIGLGQKGVAWSPRQKNWLARLRDYARLRHPMKLDFCRLTPTEMIRLLEGELARDRKDPGSYRPIVAIGHTKDLLEVDTIDVFLSYLWKNNVPVTTLSGARCRIAKWLER